MRGRRWLRRLSLAGNRLPYRVRLCVAFLRGRTLDLRFQFLSNGVAYFHKSP